MDQNPRSVDKDFTSLDRRGTPHGPFRRFLRDLIHFFSYHLILSRQSIRTTRAAGFRLRVRPTVFHPRFFLSSEYFAKFLDGLDLSGKSVCDIGTGSGILALAAARAGAAEVLALDINPHAALSALENAQANGLARPRERRLYEPPRRTSSAPAFRRDPIEPTQACWRAARSRPSWVARRPSISGRGGVVQTGQRAAEAGR